MGVESDVSDKDKPETAAKSVARMKDTLKLLLRAGRNARDAKDAIKASCVEEKLVQVKGLLQVSQGFETQLNEALSRRDKEESDRAFEKLTIAERKTNELSAEAASCIGEAAVYSGDTVVIFENSGAADTDDPTSPPFIVLPAPRPPQVSPYQ